MPIQEPSPKYEALLTQFGNTMNEEQIRELVAAAAEARRHACAPYSHFSVGAALRAADGRVFTGVNVESSSYGGTICAERTALVKALSEGVREFVAIAVVTGADAPTMPCGMCRQLLHDYAPAITVICEAGGRRVAIGLPELLPMAFGAADLE